MTKKIIVMMSLLLLNSGHVELMASASKFSLSAAVKNDRTTSLSGQSSLEAKTDSRRSRSTLRNNNDNRSAMSATAAAANSAGFLFINEDTMQSIVRNALLFAAHESINYGINYANPDASATMVMGVKIALGATLIASGKYLRDRQNQAVDVLLDEYNFNDEENIKKDVINGITKLIDIRDAKRVADFMNELGSSIARTPAFNLIGDSVIAERILGRRYLIEDLTYVERLSLFGLSQVAMPVAIDGLQATGSKKNSAIFYVIAAMIAATTATLNAPAVGILPRDHSVVVVSNTIRKRIVCGIAVMGVRESILKLLAKDIPVKEAGVEEEVKEKTLEEKLEEAFEKVLRVK